MKFCRRTTEASHQISDPGVLERNVWKIKASDQLKFSFGYIQRSVWKKVIWFVCLRVSVVSLLWIYIFPFRLVQRCEWPLQSEFSLLICYLLLEWFGCLWKAGKCFWNGIISVVLMILRLLVIRWMVFENILCVQVIVGTGKFPCFTILGNL